MLDVVIRQVNENNAQGQPLPLDLIFFSENPTNPVLSKSGTGDENDEIRNPCIVEFDATTWVQFYIARSTTRREGISYATSPKSDPHNWTKQGSLILASRPGFWDDDISGVAVIKENGTWYVYYGSWDSGAIGLATGATLLTLTRFSTDPIIDQTATSNFDKYLRHPSIIKYQDVYYLYTETREDSPNLVGFKNSNITFFTSTNLTDWARLGSPLFDDNLWNTYYYLLGMPTIKFWNGKFHMFMIGTYVVGGIGKTGPGVVYARGDSPSSWSIISHNKWGMPKRGREGVWNAGNNQEPELFLIDKDNLFLYINGRTGPTAIGNGYYTLKLDNFVDILPTALINEDFTGVSTPTDWTYTEQFGVTVTQSDGLTIDADGTQDSVAFTVVECDIDIVNINQIAFSYAFNYNVTPLNSTAELSFEVSNSDRSTGLFITRNNTAGTITGKIITDSVEIVNATGAITNDTTVKGAKDGQQAAFLKDVAGLFDFITSDEGTVFGDINLTFKIVIENKLGEATSVTFPKLVVLPYDYPTTINYL